MAKLPLASILCLIVFVWVAMAQETSQTPVEVAPETQSGYLVKKVAPVYPPLARQARIQGTVILKVIINQAGEVSKVQLFSGHPMLASAAIEAVKQWIYKPYLLNGKPVEVETQVQVNFTLANKPAPENIAGDAPGGLPAGAIGSMAEQDSVVRVSEQVMRAMRNEKVDPVYPPQALQSRIAGTVALDVRIGKSGEVERITVVRGHPMLAPAAMEAVRQWKYRPYLLKGEPAEVQTMATLTFSLSGENDSEGSVSDGLPEESQTMQIPQRVRVSSGVESGLVVKKVAPEYPPEAREQHIQGTVVLKAVIDKEGNIANLELITGDPTLAQAAMEAVKQWTYRPYLLNGNPVEVETQIQVNFVLQQ